MRALITGIGGQDGSYLVELLFEKDYEVYGLVRHSSTPHLQRIEHLLDRIHLVPGDMIDQTSLDEVVRKTQPDEVYNLAAISLVSLSWNQPFAVLDVNGIGVLRILESLRKHKPDARIYQASTSEMFGHVQEIPQTEKTPFKPCSVYGISKLLGHWAVANYRESYRIFACSGILFNHESERRGFDFVTRKITHAVARIKHGLQKELKLGNLDAIRDWGYAPDFVRAMWLMLQQNKPDDYVIATGETHTVREWLEAAFCYAGLDWHEHVIIDESLKRPAEVDLLLGDASKAKRVLSWESMVRFEEIIKRMVDADIELTRKEIKWLNNLKMS